MVPSAIRYVRPVRPVDFPATDPEWEMGETIRHQKLRETVRDSLVTLFPASAPEPAAVGSDQFLYFDPRDATRKCAPDVLLKLGVEQTPFDTWKTWVSGTPDLCVEIVSPSDHEKQTLEEKLERFHAMGVAEVVAFDPDARPGRRVRAWDLVSGDLVERIVEGDETPCLTLGLWFVVAPIELHGVTEPALRLAADAAAHGIVPTPQEHDRAERERERAEKERERAEKNVALAEKDAALAEVARLRAELDARPKATRKARR